MTLDNSGRGLMNLGTSDSNCLRFYGGTLNRETMNIYRASDVNGLIIASRTTSASNNKTYPVLTLISTDNPSTFVGGTSAMTNDLFNINWNDKPTPVGYPHTFDPATTAGNACLYLVSDTVNKMIFNTNAPYSSSYGTAPVTLNK
ncbi:TPA: hypothetical protein N0F65_004865 [Lagenidium giganteum]|uniref:Uncharacterized protein n=1 Tax=Lagenidium giganteum TaxID=4803 RepID=A0AAV2Z6Q1_9STRA|nr:TPA: hypothetical protein N0F65_004865 [Lagenidium giganteum]